MLPLQGAIKAKISKFTVGNIQPIRLKDFGHVTRIDQSETSILRFRRFLRSTGETQNIRPVIGQFWSRDMSKKKKGDCFNFKIISPFSFPLILFSFSYSSSLFSLILHFPFLSFHCIHLPLLSWFHFSLHLLCPLWWSSVCLFSLSFYQHLPFVLLNTSSALAFVVTCVFAYWHLPFFSFSTGHELFLQSCEPRTSDGLPLVSAGKFLR